MPTALWPTTLTRSFATVPRSAAATGTRRGEVCALRWSDIDLSACTVAEEPERGGGRRGARTLQTPKTRARTRTVAI